MDPSFTLLWLLPTLHPLSLQDQCHGCYLYISGSVDRNMLPVPHHEYTPLVTCTGWTSCTFLVSMAQLCLVLSIRWCSFYCEWYWFLLFMQISFWGGSLFAYNYSYQCCHFLLHTLLQAFGRMNRLNHFCLGHLYTSYAFPDNVLGLAFIAPESVSSAGGICSVSKLQKFLFLSSMKKYECRIINVWMSVFGWLKPLAFWNKCSRYDNVQNLRWWSLTFEYSSCLGDMAWVKQ